MRPRIPPDSEGDLTGIVDMVDDARTGGGVGVAPPERTPARAAIRQRRAMAVMLFLRLLLDRGRPSITSTLGAAHPWNGHHSFLLPEPGEAGHTFHALTSNLRLEGEFEPWAFKINSPANLRLWCLPVLPPEMAQRYSRQISGIQPPVHSRHKSSPCPAS